LVKFAGLATHQQQEFNQRFVYVNLMKTHFIKVLFIDETTIRNMHHSQYCDMWAYFFSLVIGLRKNL